MATLTLRILTNSGDITKGSTLSSAELDQNLISLNNELKIATTDISTIESDISTIESDISTLQTDVSGKVSKTGDDVAGNINFTGTGRRITGDFSNATVSNRLLFQNNVTDGVTSVGAIPNGTGTSSAFVAWGAVDTSNASVGYHQITASEYQLATTKTGTGTLVPLVIYVGGAERMRINTSGAVGIGGTASSADKLEVISSGATTSVVRISGDNVGDGRRFVDLQNSNTTTSTQAAIGMRAGADGSIGQIIKSGTEYTIVAPWSGRTSIYDNGAGLYFTAADAAGDIRFSTGGNTNLRMYIDASGHCLPGITNAYDLGSTTLRWRNIYTQDLHLSNGIGDYTVIEGEENLYLVNNKTNKSFKFALIEVDPAEVPEKSKVSDGT